MSTPNRSELREAAEIAGTRAFPAHPHFRGTGAALYIAGYEAGKRAERGRIADRLQILFEAVITGSIPITLQHCAVVTEMVAELRAEPYTEGE